MGCGLCAVPRSSAVSGFRRAAVPSPFCGPLACMACSPFLACSHQSLRVAIVHVSCAHRACHSARLCGNWCRVWPRAHVATGAALSQVASALHICAAFSFTHLRPVPPRCVALTVHARTMFALRFDAAMSAKTRPHTCTMPTFSISAACIVSQQFGATQSFCLRAR